MGEIAEVLPGLVLEAVVYRLVQLQQRRQRVHPRRDAAPSNVLVEARRRPYVLAAAGKVPVLQRVLPPGYRLPGVGPQRLGQRRGRGGLHHGARGDDQGVVLDVDVHEVLGVAECVGLLAESGDGVRANRKAQQALAHSLAGLEAKRHGALPHRLRVNVPGDVLDFVTVPTGHLCVPPPLESARPGCRAAVRRRPPGRFPAKGILPQQSRRAPAFTGHPRVGRSRPQSGHRNRPGVSYARPHGRAASRPTGASETPRLERRAGSWQSSKWLPRGHPE